MTRTLPDRAILVAPAIPTIVLGAYALLRGDLAPGLLGALWLAVTAPLALLAWRIHRGGEERGSPREIEAAVQALTRAEALVTAQARLVAEMQGKLAVSGAGSAPASSVTRTQALLLIAIPLLLVIAGGAYALLAVPPPLDPIHIHATFHLYADGERVRFEDPAFDLTTRGFLEAHVHVGEPDVLHIEGPPGAPLDTILRFALGVDLAADRILLDDAVHNGTRLEAGAVAPIRLFVATPHETWHESDARAAYVPADRDRLLLTFGALSGEDLAAWETAVPLRAE